MTTDPDVLNSVRIASPCHESWEGMAGDDRVRFCGSCRLNVYNLSEMSAPDAAALVRRAEGRLCVRFFQRADGTLLTKDCPKGLRRLGLRLSAIAATLVGAVGFTLGGCQREHAMGEYAPPPSAGSAGGPEDAEPRPATKGSVKMGDSGPATPPKLWMGEVVTPQPPSRPAPPRR